MNNKIDLTGQRFGHLEVLGESPNRANDRSIKWICKCDCGTVKEYPSWHLRNKTRSCGCRKIKPSPFKKERPLKERSLKERKKRKEKWFIHGMANTRLYNIWEDMKQRCLNSNAEVYKYYGAKGITICEEWLGFIGFKEWSLDNGYEDHLTIDRIDVFGNYEPTNCRWVDRKTQARNQTKTIYINHNGIQKPLTEWCEELGLRPSTVHQRIRSGFPEECLLLPPWELRKPKYKHLKRFEKTRMSYKKTIESR